MTHSQDHVCHHGTQEWRAVVAAAAAAAATAAATAAAVFPILIVLDALWTINE